MNLLERLGLKKPPRPPREQGIIDLDISGPAAAFNGKFRGHVVIERHYPRGAYSVVLDGAETYLGQEPADADAIAQQIIYTLEKLAEGLR